MGRGSGDLDLRALVLDRSCPAAPLPRAFLEKFENKKAEG